MALPSSGSPISISQIRTNMGSSSGSLRTLSALANYSSPDPMSEFYGGVPRLYISPPILSGVYSSYNGTADSSTYPMNIIGQTYGDGNSFQLILRLQTSAGVSTFNARTTTTGIVDMISVSQSSSKSGPWTFRGSTGGSGTTASFSISASTY